MFPVQKIINSIYEQKKFESDPDFGVSSNSPPQEYLTEVLNNIFDIFLETGKNNCLINGLDIDVVSIDKVTFTINFILKPGIAILNHQLIIQNENYEFSMSYDFLKDKNEFNIKYLMFCLSFDQESGMYSIIPFFVNDDTNVFNEADDIFDNNYFPIKIFNFKIFAETLYNTIYPPNQQYYTLNNIEGEFDEHELILSMYNMKNISYYNTNNIDLTHNHNSHSYPDKFIFNNIEHIVPLYSNLEMAYYEFISSNYIYDNFSTTLRRSIHP